jgi:hypothetical protein
MPNNVETTIRLVSKDGSPLSEKQAEAFFTQFISIAPEPAEGEEPRRFDFNCIIPQPKNIWSGAVGGEAEDNLKGIEHYGGLEAVRQAYRNGKHFHIHESPCLTDKQIIQFGMINGLDWNCKNWETKWGAYDCYFDWASGSVSFYTAWSVPEKIIRMVRAAALKQGYDIECEFGGELDNPGKYSDGLFMYWNQEYNDETGEWERIGDPIEVHG